MLVTSGYWRQICDAGAGHQHPKNVTNIRSPTSTCHQHLCSQPNFLEIFFIKIFSSSSWKEIYRGEKVTYRASKLLEGSVYRFRISSSNNSGDGQFSAPIEIKTLRTNPPAIKNAPAVKIEAKEAIINWSQSLNGKSKAIFRFP